MERAGDRAGSRRQAPRTQRLPAHPIMTDLPDTGTHMWTAPGLQELWQGGDRIACDHMSGLLLRSGMTAGQDGVRDASSKQLCDVGHHWVPRSVSRLGIDRSRHLLWSRASVPAFAAGRWRPAGEAGHVMRCWSSGFAHAPGDARRSGFWVRPGSVSSSRPRSPCGAARSRRQGWPAPLRRGWGRRLQATP